MNDASNRLTVRIASFGVGCLWFNLTTRPTPNQWAETLAVELNKLPSIGALKVDVFVSSVGESDDGYEVQPDLGEVEFNINVPQRVQEEILGYQTKDETFKVQMIYRFHGPVIFVLPLSPDSKIRGSEAFRVVRQFLLNELSERTSVNLELDGTPPYSFHGDFVVYQVLGDDDQASLEPTQVSRHSRDDGYDEYRVQVHLPKAKGGLYIVYHRVFNDLADELALFYSLARQRTSRILVASSISTDAQVLVSRYQKVGLRAWWSRVFHLGADTRDLSLRAISAVANEAMMLRSNERALEDLRNSTARLRFERELNEYMNEGHRAELDAARAISSTLEGNRSKEFEVAVVSASTLLGAAAGAIASILVR